ncbi:MAG: RNA methyltransferase [Bacteroidales bacterium]
MLSKAHASFIISLQKKKLREEHGLYVIEGDKMVRDYIAAGMPVETVYAKREWITSQKSGFFNRVKETVPVTYAEIKKISSLTTPHNALALVRIVSTEPEINEITAGYVIALESVQDPGNLGTIIRAASWFGIPYIICSADSVDCYNPKVVQASMGGLMWVRVFYADLSAFLGKAREENVPVFGTYPHGSSIYDHIPPERGIILFGNESKGISGFLDEYVSERLTIPRGDNRSHGIDSLNVAMSVTIVLSELSRKLR